MGNVVGCIGDRLACVGKVIQGTALLTGYIDDVRGNFMGILADFRQLPTVRRLHKPYRGVCREAVALTQYPLSALPS
jgi:hypothetical protein